MSRTWVLFVSSELVQMALACCLHGTSSEQRSPECITWIALLYHMPVNWIHRLLPPKTADVAH